VLSVADKEGRDLRTVKKGEESVDVRIEDRLSDERQCTVADTESFAETVRTDSGNSLHHLDLTVVAFDDSLENLFRRINLPSPCGTDGVGSVTPTETHLLEQDNEGVVSMHKWERIP
jgi:hypothetical protein